MVPQGTAFVHVIASWAIQDGNHDGVALFAKSANQSTAQFIDYLEPNVELSFPSTNADNDPPHQSLSLWEFELRAMPSEGSDQTQMMSYEGTLSVHVERGLEIPEFPPHPDFWNGATELVLEDWTHEVSQDTQLGLFHFCSGCVYGPVLDDGVVVPFDASEVVIDLTAESELPVLFGLRAHGANSRDYSDLEPVIDEPMHKQWRMDTDVFYGDSPYAKQTLWGFNLYKDMVRPTDSMNVGHWQGQYHVTVTTLKDS